jgi:8-oxo-dGTP diphosphatase
LKTLEVVAAILLYDGKILCAQRGLGKYEYISYKYEFPGGKLEPGESQKEALRRELIEEMDVDIETERMEFFYTVNYTYPDFHVEMHSYICEVDLPEINLKEHVSIEWLKSDELKKLDWMPADMPIVEALCEKYI